MRYTKYGYTCGVVIVVHAGGRIAKVLAPTGVELVHPLL